VLNNPIRFNDPTGHVCSDPENPNPTCFGSGTTRVGDRMVSGNGAELGEAKTIRTPNWWAGKQHIYVDGYGYFDTGHIKRGWDSAKNFFEEAELALERGDGEFTATSGGSDYVVEYWVSANINEDQMFGVLYAMYTDFELGYEEYQSGTLSFISAFSPEDLPSDHIGFWAYMNRKQKSGRCPSFDLMR